MHLTLKLGNSASVLEETLKEHAPAPASDRLYRPSQRESREIATSFLKSPTVFHTTIDVDTVPSKDAGKQTK